MAAPAPYHSYDSRVASEVAPCDGCRHAARCKADRLACIAALRYANGLSAVRVQAAPRVPTREFFEQLFG
jgi:hypothetical protein